MTAQQKQVFGHNDYYGCANVLKINVHTNACFNINMYLAARQQEKKEYSFKPTK